MSRGPRILALETATRVLSAALLRGEELVAEERVLPARSAAEGLLPTVDLLLRGAAWEVAGLEAFAVSIGPGSFTSLRIGIATVKGLAFGSSRPVAPVPTLAGLARAAPEGEGPVVALLDARRGELYAAAYARGGEQAHASVPEGVYTPEELALRLPRSCALVGEGAALFGERLRERIGPGVALHLPPAGEPRARHVGVLGARLLVQGLGREPAALVPRYVRRAEAEVKRTGERFEGPPRGP